MSNYDDLYGKNFQKEVDSYKDFLYENYQEERDVQAYNSNVTKDRYGRSVVDNREVRR